MDSTLKFVTYRRTLKQSQITDNCKIRLHIYFTTFTYKNAGTVDHKVGHYKLLDITNCSYKPVITIAYYKF